MRKRRECLVVSNLLATFADENRIWEMAHGYSQIYGYILGYGLYWVNEGKKEEKVKSKRR